MKNYALAIANEFVELSMRDSINITLLKLVKLCYIAHGFMLAALDRPTTGEKYDQVEAWEYGPVFPVVYHSFKHYKRDYIRSKDVEINSEGDEFTPTLTDDKEKSLCDFVWKTYKEWTASDLVDILHAEGSPWQIMFKSGKNVVIPDEITKKYYTAFIKKLINS